MKVYGGSCPDGLNLLVTESSEASFSFNAGGNSGVWVTFTPGFAPDPCVFAFTAP